MVLTTYNYKRFQNGFRFSAQQAHKTADESGETQREMYLHENVIKFN